MDKDLGDAGAGRHFLSARRGSQRGWLWIGAIFAAVGLFDAMQTVFGMQAMGMHHNWTALFIASLLAWLPWACATPLVIRLERRFPPVQPNSNDLAWSAWPVHLAAAIAISTVCSAWVAWMFFTFNPYALSPPPQSFLRLWSANFYGGLLASCIVYSVIIAIVYVLESRERLARQQTETARLNELLSKSELQALRRQIEPHFLFNTLNSIAGLVREKRNDDAVTMIVRLSEFLRRVVDDSSRQMVPLAEEMAFLEQYLEIQKVRFADRLQLSVDVPRELMPAQVPSLLLQPMVENAIKHGIARRVQGGAIRISAARNNGTLIVRIYNDGPGLPADWESAGRGVGISNVRTRLRGLYGDAFGLSMENQEPDGVEACVTVPFAER